MASGGGDSNKCGGDESKERDYGTLKDPRTVDLDQTGGCEKTTELLGKLAIGDGGSDEEEPFEETDLRTDEGLPMDAYAFDWVVTWDDTGKSPKPKKGAGLAGKWMIFEPSFMNDDTWKQIKKATEAGELGHYSMVSAMKDKEKKAKIYGKNHVICVFTYDHRDEADVMRVRQALRKLGFSSKLKYKTDEATNNNEYRHTVHRRVSKFIK